MDSALPTPQDPGLAQSQLRYAGKPHVGTRSRPLARMAEDSSLNEVLMELYSSFGPQSWWPAATPFEVILGALLTQNASWRNAELALAELRRRDWLDPHSILEADSEQLEATLRPSGTFRAKARKLREVSNWYLARGGLEALRAEPLEPLRKDLLGVWGVGPETADCILCYAAGRRSPIVDTYTRRILDRHALVPMDTPLEDCRQWLRERLIDDQLVYEEFHALCVRAGNQFCKPSPDCAACPATTPQL